MKLRKRYKKHVAATLLLVMLLQLLAPTVGYALTSGPSQPEMSGFAPAGNTEMVDLFSGDFSYNIPLMDVGGYPLNLAYRSGSGMDDEASWVGYGWSLNAGSLNRQLRGLPDDFNGTDQIQRETKVKDHITKGGRFSATLDLLGIPLPKIKKNLKKKNLNLKKPTFSIGVKHDNYRGIGVELGVNAGLSLSDYVAGENNTMQNEKNFGNVGLNLSSFDGASFSVNPSILSKELNLNDKTGISKSIGFGYNTRQGLAGMTLNTSFSSIKTSAKEKPVIIGSESNSFFSFNGESYTPSIAHPTNHTSFTFTFHPGLMIFVAYPGFGITGFYSKQATAKKIKSLRSYGYLHSDKAKDNSEALMDINREKDVPYHKDLNYLPIPVPTYDLFTATSQDGAGQYRAYQGSSGIYADPKTLSQSKSVSLGIEGGIGTYFDVGADLYFQPAKTITQKWLAKNDFVTNGDFQLPSTSSLYEQTYFKRVGEPVPSDKSYFNKLKASSPVAVFLPKNVPIAGAIASNKLRTKTSTQGETTSVLKRDAREVRNTTFSYLTGKEASQHGHEKTIKDYHPDSLVINNCNPAGIKNNFQRTGSPRKGHHISEVTITGDDGKRSVYGVPVYNSYQEEVSFSIASDTSKRKNGLIGYANGADNSLENDKGREKYFSKEITPPYTTSHLLTSILSPDYVDKTANGISDDDLGTAVKFNYTRLNGLYNWRTPVASSENIANYNEGFLSDALDDKANYLYGEKEVWYMHSVESKTMIAHFITEDRDDGLGVLNSSGGINTSVKLKLLKEIRLYSKSDLKLNGNDPSKTIPIKVAHFVYNYSICRGLPNSITGGGKLSLEKVYFTFGNNNKGRMSPYEFQYDTSYNQYSYRQYDRWGNFKDAAGNPGGLSNSEFPYTLQDTLLTNRFASNWQLNNIILPSGGSIRVAYESDDYAYVQDKRASQMCFLNGTNAPGVNTGLINSDFVHISLPMPVNNRKEMLEKYFEGVDKLYFKCLLTLDNKGHKEFVPGYAQIIGKPELVGNNTAKVRLQKISGKNPIAKFGWQFLRMNLPKYAYPGSENIESQDDNLKKVITALVGAFSKIKEVVYGFEKRAQDKGFSNTVDLQKSWVRLSAPTKKKLGGGARVKRIDISDNWAAMSGAPGAQTATYSQLYGYTTKDDKGQIISSGVASYEPSLGNDENPFRQPVNYKQKQFLALDNYFYIEEPFCESLFPAASVGYSKVTVKSIGTGDAETVNRTGTTVSEFYTAKEYPTKTDVLGLVPRQSSKIGSLITGLLGAFTYDILGLSQGYAIELNDMHGKPKAVKVFNKSGQNISSIDYFYKTTNENAEKKHLNNDVKVIDSTGTVSDATIGRDVEVYTDMREQETANIGISAKASGGSGAVLYFPIPFAFPGVGMNVDIRSYRAASTIKIINRFAIQHKTITMQNGSSITSENLLWDAETGNVLLTKTQNEFDDPIYSFAYPAHWVYDGMSQAYRNSGTILSNFSTGANGVISNSVYKQLLTPGDELIDINSSQKYWVVNTPVSGTHTKRIIDKNGDIKIVNAITVKLLRSGRRNMANTAIATITSLNNPIAGDKLDVTAAKKILDAKAIKFSDEWEMPLNRCVTCPAGYTVSTDGQTCIKDTVPGVTHGCYTVCEGSHDLSYSLQGTFIYQPGYDIHGNGTVTHSITNPSNQLWVGGNCGSAKGASFSAPLSDSGNVYDSSEANQSSKNISLSPPKSSGELIPGVLAADPGDTCIQNPNAPWNTQYCGPLHRSGIWTCRGTDANNNRIPVNEWLGFSKCINVSSTKTFYIGIAGDNHVRFYIDGVLKLSITTCDNQSPFIKWRIYPITLTQGQHTIELEGNNCGLKASFGAEIYDNTAQELASATSMSQLNIIFSTRSMVGREFDRGRYSCPSGYVLNTCDSPFTCRSILPATQSVFNPYFEGVLGNWRPKSQHVYQINRENIASDLTKPGSTNIRKSGAYSVFNPFWQHDDGAGKWNQNPTGDNRWIAANSVNYFNTKGLEIENSDALGRYSSALFGYLNSLPVAVASNTRYRELAYDGFEDYNFSLDCAQQDTCSQPHFNFKKQLSGSVSITNQDAHSGKHSLALSGSVTLNKTVYSGESDTLYSYDHMGQYLLRSRELSKGFSPIPGKKYLLSFWVKDGNPRDGSTSVQASVNGSPLVSNLTRWPIVEGWKRVEVPFILPAIANGFTLQLSSGGQVQLDDLRIHPFDGQMKSFAYDPSSQRLMAELDENNFATFYEYDDEGILIRVKKETERGVMTIKETRSSNRKR